MSGAREGPGLSIGAGAHGLPSAHARSAWAELVAGLALVTGWRLPEAGRCARV